MVHTVWNRDSSRATTWPPAWMGEQHAQEILLNSKKPLARPSKHAVHGQPRGRPDCNGVVSERRAPAGAERRHPETIVIFRPSKAAFP